MINLDKKSVIFSDFTADELLLIRKVLKRDKKTTKIICRSSISRCFVSKNQIDEAIDEIPKIDSLIYKISFFLDKYN